MRTIIHLSDLHFGRLDERILPPLIERITEVASGYELSLVCTAEGQTRRERVFAAVSGDMLSLVYLDRGDTDPTRLGRCPGSPKPEAQTSGLMKMLKR